MLIYLDHFKWRPKEYVIQYGKRLIEHCLLNLNGTGFINIIDFLLPYVISGNNLTILMIM